MRTHHVFGFGVRVRFHWVLDLTPSSGASTTNARLTDVPVARWAVQGALCRAAVAALVTGCSLVDPLGSWDNRVCVVWRARLELTHTAGRHMSGNRWLEPWSSHKDAHPARIFSAHTACCAVLCDCARHWHTHTAIRAHQVRGSSRHRGPRTTRCTHTQLQLTKLAWCATHSGH